MPSLAATAGSQPTQAKGGTSLAVTPLVYEKHTTETPMDFEYTPGFVDRMGTKPGSHFYHRKVMPSASVTPDHLGFTATLINQLDHVFRSTGAVVSLNVDGKTIAFDATGIKNFLDVLVLPGGRTQVTIWGPPISYTGCSIKSPN